MTVYISQIYISSSNEASRREKSIKVRYLIRDMYLIFYQRAYTANIAQKRAPNAKQTRSAPTKLNKQHENHAYMTIVSIYNIQQHNYYICQHSKCMKSNIFNHQPTSIHNQYIFIHILININEFVFNLITFDSLTVDVY